MPFSFWMAFISWNYSWILGNFGSHEHTKLLLEALLHTCLIIWFRTITYSQHVHVGFLRKIGAELGAQGYVVCYAVYGNPASCFKASLGFGQTWAPWMIAASDENAVLVRCWSSGAERWTAKSFQTRLSRPVHEKVVSENDGRNNVVNIFFLPRLLYVICMCQSIGGHTFWT